MKMLQEIEDQDYQNVEEGQLVADRVEQALRREIASLRKASSNAILPKQSVLAGRYGVSRRSIREAVERLKKDNLVKSIRGKGTFIVGQQQKLHDVLLIGNDTQRPYGMMSIAELSSILYKKDFHAKLVTSSDPEQQWDDIISRSPNACGAIVISPYAREVIERLVVKSELTIVSTSELDEPVRSPAACTSVLPSHETLGYKAAEYLIQQGHSNIAFITWNLDKAEGYGKIRGYRDALSAYGIEYNPNHVIQFPRLWFSDNTDIESRQAAITELQRKIDLCFQNGASPTALIHEAGSEAQLRDILSRFFGDRFALEAVVGLAYKEQLSSGYAGWMDEITMICSDFKDIARRAVQLLLDPKIDNNSIIREVREKVHVLQRRNGIWQEVTNGNGK